MNSLLVSLALGLALGATTIPMTASADASPEAPSWVELLGLHTRGVNYQLGRGVPQDLQAAAQSYLLSARLGHADSQNDLAKLYDDGRGVPRDEVRAYFWYTLASERGNTCAVLDRQKLAAGMSVSSVAESDRLLQAWRAGEPVAAMSRLD